MPRSCTPLPPDTEKKLRELLRTHARTRRDAQRIQSMLCRVAEQYTAAKTGRIVGLSEPTVKRIWSAFLRDGFDALLGEKRGQARGRAHLPARKERAFLLPFLRKAERGKLTTVREIHAAHCERVGKSLDPTVTYRLLGRHGWRRVVPRPTHPRADHRGQETFKAFFPQDRCAGENRSSSLWSPFPVDVPR
jgi:uncharacterized protein with von Willebrand factor type A (vWA) domain